MQRRVLNVYFVRENNQLFVRFIEMRRLVNLKELDIMQHITERDSKSFEQICRAVHDEINYEYIGYTVSAMYKNNQSSTSNLTYNKSNYEYNELIMPLHAGVEFLLKQIGPLDGALHYYKKEYDKCGGCKINFPSAPVNFSDPSSILSSTKAANAEFPEPKHSMTRSLAKWIVDEVEKDPEALQAYRDAVPELKQLLALDDASLTYPIRYKYYPLPALQSRIKEVLELAPFKAAMVDASTSCEEKDRLIISWVRSQLHPEQKPKSLFTLFGEVLTGEKLEEVKTDDCKQTINNMFEDLHALRAHLWTQRVEGLVGMTGYDGGPYRGSSRELHLLKFAEKYLNKDGLMVLDYHKLCSYTDVNDVDLESSTETKREAFEYEMRHACQLLGLEVLPNQDFYNKKAVTLTRESTRKLMDWGYHLTKEHVQRLLLAAYDLRKLNMVVKQSPDLNKVPNDVIALMLKDVEQYVPDDDLRAMSAIRMGNGK